jgi:gamma-glutamyltranspeptidase/glutathione hydrolase
VADLALYYEADTNKVYALDGVSWSGTHATAEFFRDPDVPAYGMHQANVPGAWEGGMIWLDRFGSKDLGELMFRAIELADNGHPANKDTINAIARQQDDILRMPHTKAVFMPEGRVPELGEIIYQKDMANTLRSLVQAYNDNLKNGRSAAFQAANDYYYRGPIAEKIVAFSKENGGHFELSDFHESKVEGIVEPISIDYKGITVYECPPNSQGITTLMALNILKGFDFSQYEMDSPEVIHLIVEALKLAHTDKYYYIATPDLYDNPVEELLSDEHAAKQRARISMDSVLEWPIKGGLGDYQTPRLERGNTTTYSVVDNMVMWLL